MSIRKNAVNTGKAKSSAKKGLHFTADELRKMHWDIGLSMKEIGAHFEVSGAAITYWMNKYGLEHRAQLQDVLFEPSRTLSYVYGVLHGDGFLYTNPASDANLIILSVVDKPFALSFQAALTALGLRAPMISIPARSEHRLAQWKVYATSKRFHELWRSQTSDMRLCWGLTYPEDFIRGVYESEGSIKYHRGSLELVIYNTNEPMQRLIYNAISDKGWTVKWFQRPLESGKTFVYVQMFRSLEIRRFIAWIRPCIKCSPRCDGYANPVPNQDRDILEGLESTKDDQNGC